MATWANTPLCTVADVRARAPEVDASFNQGKTVIGSAEITKKIALAKDMIRQDLIVKVTPTIASTAQQWLDTAQSLADRRRENIASEYNRAGLDPITAGDGATSSLSFSSETRRIIPQTFLHSDTPTNGTTGTQAGYAENGARLVDTKYDTLYINRGTLASPTWGLLTADTAIDYITNPTELKHCAVDLSLVLLYEDRVHRFTATHDTNFDRLASIVAHCRQQYKEHFATAFAILTFDLSNDGTVQSFERSATRNTQYFA